MTARRANSESLRLFAALDLPPELSRETASFGREVARMAQGLRAVPPENTHVTLAFLGSRNPAELQAITGAIEEATATQGGDGGTGIPVLSLGAPIWLPRRRPRALALEINDDSGRLADLHRRLARNLGAAIDWAPERAFRPHLTVARSGRGARLEGLELPPGPSAEFAPESVSLVLSRLTPEGAEYEALATFGT